MTSMLTPLGSVAEIIMGQSPDGIHYNKDDDGLPLLTGAGQFGELFPEPTQYSRAGAKVSVAGDIIMGIRASIGDLNWSDKEYYLGRGVAALRPRENLFGPFLWHYLGTQRDFLNSRATGSTFKQIKKEDLAELLIPLPPLYEQRRRAAILDQADDLRRKRRESIERLKTLPQALFIEMFGNQKANPRLPLEEVVEHVTVGHVGATTKYFCDDGIPFLRTGNVGLSEIDLSNLKKITPAFHRALRKSTLCTGDILVSRVISSEIRCAVVPPELDGANCANVVIIHPGSKISSEYLASLIRLGESQQNFLSRQVGSAQSVVNTKVFQKWVIPVPSMDQQIEYSRRVRVVLNVISMQQESLAQLDVLFSSLQYRAFAGELTPSTVEATLASA